MKQQIRMDRRSSLYSNCTGNDNRKSDAGTNIEKFGHFLNAKTVIKILPPVAAQSMISLITIENFRSCAAM